MYVVVADDWCLESVAMGAAGAGLWISDDCVAVVCELESCFSW